MPSISFERKSTISIEIFDIQRSLTLEQVTEKLTQGLYEIYEGTGNIIDAENGEVVAQYQDWESEDLTHGDFEMFDE